MIPFILGALGVVAISELTKKGGVSKMAHGGDIDTKRKMFLHDAVLYKGDLLYITNKNGVLGLANLKQGAWGSDYPFIPISKVNMDDVTDMMGRKISIEGYANGGSMNYYLVTFGYKGDDGYEIVTSKPILANSEEEASMMLKKDFEMNEGISCDIISVKKKI